MGGEIIVLRLRTDDALPVVRVSGEGLSGARPALLRRAISDRRAHRPLVRAYARYSSLAESVCDPACHPQLFFITEAFVYGRTYRLNGHCLGSYWGRPPSANYHRLHVRHQT